MGTLKADVDALNALSGTLHQLADEVGADKVGGAAGPGLLNGGDVTAMAGMESGNSALDQTADLMSGVATEMASLRAAAQVCLHLIDGDLLPAVEERLKTTGDVMADIAKAYQGKDDAAGDALATAYRNAVGDWTVGRQP